MSGASASRKRKANELKKQTDRRNRVNAAKSRAGVIQTQLALAQGSLNRSAGYGNTYTDSSGRKYTWVRVAYRGGTKPTKIYAASPSQIAGLQRSLKIARVNTRVVQTQIQLESYNDIPLSSQAVFASHNLYAKKSERDKLGLRSTDKGRASKIHGLKTDLFNLGLEVQSISSGKPVSSFSRAGAPIPPFLIAGRAQKLKTLSTSSGFDVGKQLQMTNERFGLELSVDDITANFVTGGLLGQAKTIFNRNKKINKLKETLVPAQPEIVPLDEFSDFDFLYERRASMVSQQQTKLGELNKIGDEDLRIARIETDLPMFSSRAGEIDGLIGGLETRISDIKKTRKPQELLSSTGTLTRFGLKDLVNRRNKLTRIRNEKVDLFNAIKDPALRHVSKEQDIPQFDARIFKLDADIDRGVKFGESRDQLNIGIVNAPVKRRGRAPKTFDVFIGDDKRTFKRTERGAKRATLFFETQKTKKNKELDSILDPIERQIAKDQDFGILDLGISASKTQRKVLKSEKRQELENLNIGGAVGGQGFLPYTPSNTPTGKLAIQPIRKSRNVPKVFDQLSFGRSRSVNRNQFDLGRMFGQSRGRTKISKRQRGSLDFF